jgi:hypothetical protein
LQPRYNKHYKEIFQNEATAISWKNVKRRTTCVLSELTSELLLSFENQPPCSHSTRIFFKLSMLVSKRVQKFQCRFPRAVLNRVSSPQEKFAPS